VSDWPRSPGLDACRAAALASSPPEDPTLLAALRKVAGGLASSERALLVVPEYADVLAARIALECALAEGARLFGAGPSVDEAAVDALAKSAADATERMRLLEGKTRELDELRLFASAQTALHRALQTFQDLAGRLRKAGKRSVGLDPSAARAPAPPAEGEPAEQPSPAVDAAPDAGPRWRLAVLGVLLALFALATVRAIFFSAPLVEELNAEAAGADVAAIRISGTTAAVTVRSGWQPAQLQPLLSALRLRGVTSAVLLLDSGAGLGQLDVESGKLYAAFKADGG